ncbi:hypothetical protein FHS68_002075 [Dyadobacter arcticus]|uniref:Por secretion system C-terminal sorting domain-containing protein n=2 Tax=Dyadobacter arcticus TaxID=1078754 RepID=A0ABX0UMP9_9BACT|nr:hypothetical protein [Dyadobacter arcticus]
MYINGVATPNSAGFGSYVPVGTVRVGGQNGGRYFAGAIDEVKIFDVSLSPEEVMEEYTSSAPQIVYRGSGNALQFDGSDDFVDIGGAFADPNFTVDLWLKPGETQTPFANVIDNNHTDSQNWFCQQEADNTNVYSFGISGAVATFQLTAGVWQQLTLVKRSSSIEVYLNGILISSSLLLQPLNYVSPSLRLGAWGGTGRNWNGSMDELRIWNTDLSEAEIRERMCRKITPADEIYDNLVSYYNFNSENSNTLTDLKSDQDGTLQNSPTWVTSWASLGDASAYSYGGSDLSISNAQGESLTLSDFTGSPTGVHIYYVGTVPNSISGIEGVGANNRYFGVFHFGGTDASYTTTYHYGGNPFVNANNEPGLKIYKRANNAVPTWSPGSLEFTNDPVANTITIESDDSEYMLGSTSEPLPVRLLSFNAKVKMGDVKLSWSTAEEVNASHFIAERSADARIFEKIGQVDAAGNSRTRQDYALVDETPLQGTSYYRLRQVDLDGKEFIYRVAAVRIEAAFSQTVYPNPANAGVLYLDFKGDLADLALTDMTGRKMKIETQRISSGLVMIRSKSQLAPGLYLLTAVMGRQVATHHVVVLER